MGICPIRMRKACARVLIGLGRAFDEKVPICCDRISWAAGPFLVAFGVILIVLLSALGFVFVIPAEVKSREGRILANTLLVVGVLNVCARYISAVGTNPGTPTSIAYNRAVKARILSNEVLPPSLLAWTTCRHTGILKPPRAHFDSVNRQLVMNFDHWCPWLFNSVGYGNYRHFLVFLFWIWLLTSYGVILAAAPFFEGLKRGHLTTEMVAEVAFAVVFCLCFALSVAVGILFGWHLYLTLTAQTSVDFLILYGRRAKIDANYPNPFDKGSIVANLKQVLFSEHGGWWELIIPPFPWKSSMAPPFPGAW